MTHDNLIERARYEPLRPTPPDPVADALETFPYGLYIVGSRGEDGTLNAMMADWLMQVSFKPRPACCSVEDDAPPPRFTRPPRRAPRTPSRPPREPPAGATAADAPAHHHRPRRL